MNSEIAITTERIDDFAFLLEVMIRLGLPGLVDRHLKRHGLHQGLSWGWIAAIWLAHILTESDHRKLPVRAWVRQAGETIERITGMTVSELDFTDDRLTLLLRRLSKPATWQAIETELGRNILRVYEMKPKQVRLDPTTVSGYHAGGEDSLFEFGHSKDDPSLRQVKGVVAGSTADEPLYIPAVDQVLEIIEGVGLLFVGDSKMSAQDTRTHIQRLNQRYLCPLALTGKMAEEMSQWIEAANRGDFALQPVLVEAEQGKRKQLAPGYGLERTVSAEIIADDPAEVQEWMEQVFMVRSESYRQTLQKGLDGRLQRATDKLRALTPPPGRGKRPIQEEGELTKAADAILMAHEVAGLLTFTFERQENRQTKYMGRGRGNAERPTRQIVTMRCQITAVVRQEEAITALQKTFSWRAYVTNTPAQQLTLEQAVLTYRDAWLIEHGFHRLKGAPLSLDPLFVKRDDQVVGLINLLSMAVRFLTLIELVVRRKLKQNQEKLTGLIENNPKKGIDNPTTERLLKTFDNVTLTIVHLPDQTIRHITPLSPLQTRILELLGLSAAVYTRLAEN